MIKKFRELLCWLYGHRSICIYRWKIYDERKQVRSEITVWLCECCEEITNQQYDN